jgi:glycosyltransferase involved in cell wall biosynthesis
MNPKLKRLTIIAGLVKRCRLEKMKEILYFTDARIPSEKANVYQTLKTCDELRKKGAEIILVVPRKWYQTKKMKKIGSIQEYYKIGKLKITKLPVIDHKNSFLYLWYVLTFSLSSLIYLLYKKIVTRKKLIIYNRFYPLTTLFTLAKPIHKSKIIYEAHCMPMKKMDLWALKRGVDKIVTITEKLKELHIEEGVSEEKILVAPDGVDLQMFRDFSKENARKELNIPFDKKVICYTGHLYEWKGVHILAESMKHLPQYCLLYVVGGTEEDVLEFKEFIKKNKIQNVVVEGYVEPSLVSKYLAAADVVVLPNTKDKISEKFTSPLKLFEYMASKRPIVASALQSIREVLNEENAVLVEPENSKAIAEGVKKVLSDKALAKKIVKNAYKDVQNYTWEKRAERILKVIEKAENMK